MLSSKGPPSHPGVSLRPLPTSLTAPLVSCPPRLQHTRHTHPQLSVTVVPAQAPLLLVGASQSLSSTHSVHSCGTIVHRHMETKIILYRNMTLILLLIYLILNQTLHYIKWKKKKKQQHSNFLSWFIKDDKTRVPDHLNPIFLVLESLSLLVSFCSLVHPIYHLPRVKWISTVGNIKSLSFKNQVRKK